MDHGLDYGKISSELNHGKWTEGGSSVLSFEERTSIASASQSQDYYLQLKQSREIVSERPEIPATKMERLSFYRAYVSSPCKIQIICMQRTEFNQFLWHYLLHVFFKSLPHTFVHIFLASYTPEEHIFLTKMLPICYGFKYFLILASFFDITRYLNNITYLFHFTFYSIMFNNPWNRCSRANYTDAKLNVTVHCYELADFATKFVNDTPVFKNGFYYSKDKEMFSLPQLLFFRDFVLNPGIRKYVYWFILWIFFAVIHGKVLQHSFWQMLNRCQWIVNFIDLASFLYVVKTYFQDRMDGKTPVSAPVVPIIYKLWEADFDMLAESTTAPPVIHVLTARSTQTIDPSGDSAMIMLSNAICFIFRGLLTYRVKKYCESQVNAPIFLTELNQYSWFYFFPIFYSTFLLGGLYTAVFFIMNFATEILTITVTYQCLVEVVVYEWRSIKRSMAVLIFTAFGCASYYLYNNEGFKTGMTIYLYGKSLATLFEIVFVYLLYPLGRLVDDYMFHTGEELTTLKVLCLRIVPFFYAVKVYKLWIFFISVKYGIFEENRWAWGILLGPLLLGTLIVLYNYIFKYKKDWKLLFRPCPTWGPRDCETRQIRKQYDSRYYVASQFPRLLSRYLLKKEESDTYNLDLKYDKYDKDRQVSRRSTTNQESKIAFDKKFE